MPTPHIAAAEGDFAADVLMPGDPKRAARIAESLLDDAVLVTDVRGILGYTGNYQGRRVSVMASGMGMPSLAIYATELARFYGVRRIIRVGTVGALQPHVKIGEVIAASCAHTDSAFTASWVPGVSLSAAPSFTLLNRAFEYARDTGETIHVGPVFTSDHFYGVDETVVPALAKLGTIAVDMEAAGLYAVAQREAIEALMLGTVSDKSGETNMTALERETTFATVARIALEALR
ncbi:MAG: purine-nucleoside phosphorylase [Gordonia sp. (in: high G+C Gram-positive bacteria)]